ncbi:hypothetical protein [Halobacterium sp. R2-5]|uniref:DUF5789 family protein n=1 Tax=Halobacterium sp. R2-5 TaxID=2715751 RepID=UPI001422A7AB|nr:hypothetical protein [Halobacterium sp. R2-5]NIB98168.1 hypothetical protein [Halobacterium sp. R2-5]
MTLRETATLLETQDYPLTADELADAVGDHDLAYPDGEEPLEAVIRRCGEQRFEDAQDATFAVYSALDADAVGRVGYSDRDPTPMGVDGPPQVSF